MPDPLAVILQSADGGIRRQVARELIGDLVFSSIDPGGFEACSIALARQVGADFPEMRAFAHLTVVDKRTMQAVWDGRLSQPGQSNRDGPQRSIDAVGPALLADDELRSVVYHDTSLTSWVQAQKNLIGASSVSADEDTNADLDSGSLVETIPTGTVLTTNDAAVARYAVLHAARQRLLRIQATVSASQTSASYAQDIVGRGVGGAGASSDAQLATVNFNTSPSTLSAVLGTDFSTTHFAVDLRSRYTGAGVTSGSENRGRFRSVLVCGERLDTLGNATTRSATPIPMWHVVEDVVGRYLQSAFDGASAFVDQGANYGIDQLVYESPVSGRQILEDMMVLAPGYTWHGWERQASGLHSFEWVAYPTTVDVQLSSAAGFDSPATSADVYDQVEVHWQDQRGRNRTTRRSSFVAALGGLHRTGTLDLSRRMGSAAAAAAIGDLWLAAHAAPTNSGTLTVAGPVHSRTRGVIMPWEWRPGVNVQLIDTLPLPSGLYQDGISTFRVTGCRYSSSAGTVELQLDSWGSSVRRQLVALQRRLARMEQP